MKRVKILYLSFIIYIICCAFSNVRAVCYGSHNFTIFECTVEKATCTKNGRAQYRCENCSAITIKSTGKLAHKYTKFVKTVDEPTCTKSGKDQYKCATCSATTYKLTNKIAHNYNKFVKITKEPTCTEAGKSEYKCETCTATTIKNTGKLAHKYTKFVKTVDKPTCTKSGKDQYRCATCSATTYKLTDKIAHNYNIFVKITKDPTCTEAGKVEYKCEMCTATKIKNRAKLAHKYTVFKEITEDATCQKEGKAEYKCETCTATTIKNTVKLGHKYTKFVKTEEHPTCIKNGKDKYKCATCEETTYKSTAKVGHDYSVSVIKKATCQESGKEEYTCKVCGDYKYKITAKDPNNHYYEYAYCDVKTHKKVCKECHYEMTNLEHLFKDNICRNCGADKTKIFDINSEAKVKELQTYLKNLMYYNKDIDGVPNSYLVNKINEIIEDHGYSDRISNISEINDYIYRLVIDKCKNSKIEIEKEKNFKPTDKTILSEEENKKFEDIITICMLSNITYNQDKRYVGYDEITNQVKNNEFTLETKELYMDCSSYVSTVMNATFGIECKNEEGSLYNTNKFYEDETNFYRTDYSQKAINVDDLKKGQLILCKGKEENHIVIYIGDGWISHTGGKDHNAISRNELSENNDSTKAFLSTEYGKYNEIFVLTPKR